MAQSLPTMINICDRSMKYMEFLLFFSFLSCWSTPTENYGTHYCDLFVSLCIFSTTLLGGATNNPSLLAHISFGDAAESRWYTQTGNFRGCLNAGTLAIPCYSHTSRDKWFGKARKNGCMERAFDRSCDF